MVADNTKIRKSRFFEIAVHPWNNRNKAIYITQAITE